MGSLHVRVQPGARRTGFAGWFGEHPKIAIAAPPVEGAANAVLIDFVAQALGVRRRDVRVAIGGASRTKRLEIDGLDDAAIVAAVSVANPRPPG